MIDVESRFISRQTIPLSELIVSNVGAEGVYFLAVLEGMAANDISHRLQSQIKQYFRSNDALCEIEGGLFFADLTGDTADNAAVPMLMVKVVQSAKELDERVKRGTLGDPRIEVSAGQAVIYTDLVSPHVNRYGFFLREELTKRIVIQDIAGIECNISSYKVRIFSV
jgi:hypothetical protein